MENNNGKGIFYGVIGIATLIVAIVGATFAYFSATYETSNTAINITSYSGFSVSLSMSKIAPSVAVNKLIPLDSTAYMASALTHKNSEGVLEPCIDVNGDQVCAIYEMTLTNNGDSAVDVVGYLSADVNDYTTNNLKYQIYNCTDGDDTDTVVDTFAAIDGSAAVDAPAFGVTVTDLPKFVVTNGQTDNTIISIPAKVEGEDAPTATYCLVLWLEEYKVGGVSQSQNEDQGKTFAGKVTFNATTGSGEKLEAKFN